MDISNRPTILSRRKFIYASSALSLIGGISAAKAQMLGGDSSQAGPGQGAVHLSAFGAQPGGAPNTRATNADALKRALDASYRNSGIGAEIAIPPGTYAFDPIHLAAGGNPNRILLRGTGIQKTVLEFGAPDEDAITITGGAVCLQNITISSAPDRASGGAGHGIVAHSPINSTTQNNIQLSNVVVMNQPGDGIRAYDPELHRYSEVACVGNGGNGVSWLTDRKGGISNLMSQVRCIRNRGGGIYLEGRTSHSVLEVSQCLQNSGTQLRVHCPAGVGIVLIEPDIEAYEVVSRGQATTGLVLTGTGHRVIGGAFYALTVGIELAGAHYCTIDMPQISNSGLSVPMQCGVLEHAGAGDNRVMLPRSMANVTAPYQRG